MVLAGVRPEPVAFVLVAAAAGLLWAGQGMTRRAASTPQAPVAVQVGPWTGKVMPVDQKVVDILETPDVSIVEYRRGEQPPVWFGQVAGFGNRAAFHPPELCYVGSHFEVLERDPVTVMVNGKSMKIMRLVIGQGKQRFEAWYWFTANGRVTSDYYQQQLWLMGDALRGRAMSGTLVRISTSADDGEASYSRLLEFMSFLDASSQAASG